MSRETKLTVSSGSVVKCFVISPNSKIEKIKLRRNRLLDAGWLTNLVEQRINSEL